MEERTGWRGENESQTGGEEKRNGRLYGAAETSKELAEWRRLQRKNWNILGLPKRKEWPQCQRERADGKNARAALSKRKRNRAVSPKYQIMGGESQDGREPHLGESEEDQSESMGWKGWTPR